MVVGDSVGVRRLAGVLMCPSDKFAVQRRNAAAIRCYCVVLIGNAACGCSRL